MRQIKNRALTTREWTESGVYYNTAVFYSKDLLGLYNQVREAFIFTSVSKNSNRY